MLQLVTTVHEELEKQAAEDDQIIMELETENMQLRKLLAISEEFTAPSMSLEIETTLKGAELRSLQLKELVTLASDQIKKKAQAKRLAEAESKKEMMTSDFNLAANLLGDASKIDGVALTNRLPQMSTPKQAYLLSADNDDGKVQKKGESIFDYESAF